MTYGAQHTHSKDAVMRPLAHHGPADPVAWSATSERNGAQLWSDLEALARALPGAKEDQPLVLICADRYHFAVGLLAAWRGGHRVILPPNGQPETVNRVAITAGAQLLMHDTDQRPASVAELRLPQVLGEGGSQGTTALRDGFDHIALDRVLVTAFTSGSTGEFQPVDKTAGQLFAEVACLARTFEVNRAHRILATVPPHHIYGLLFGVLLPLCSGAVLSRATPLHAETLAAQFDAFGATHLVTVPAHLSGLELLEPGRLAGIERLFSSTAPLPASAANMMLGRHGLVATEVLGSTETGGIAWRHGADELWQPLAGVQVSADQSGRLHVRSPFIDPTWPQPAPTEDRVRFDGPGFRHLGRLDGVVKVGGKRLALAHLESCLLALAGVQDAAALAVQSGGTRGMQVWAVVVAPGLDFAALRQGLSRWFEPAQLPRRVRFVDALPREPTGKLRRARLLELFEGPAPAANDRALTDVLPVLHHHGPERDPTGAVERHVLKLFVPENFARFDGHFANWPVLPGVATLHDAVMAQVQTLHPELGQPNRVRNLKFHRVVGPNVELEVRLAFFPGRVDFEVAEGSELTASGRLLFEGPQ